MPSNSFRSEDGTQDFVNRSYTSVIREIGSSTKQLIRSEINLLVVELKSELKKVGKHLTQLMLLGALFILSVIPFLAFLVLSIGLLLNERYWLSSLIVSILFALISGGLAFSTLRKIKERDLKMLRSKAYLNAELLAVQKNFSDLKSSFQGGHHESH